MTAPCDVSPARREGAGERDGMRTSGNRRLSHRIGTELDEVYDPVGYRLIFHETGTTTALGCLWMAPDSDPAHIPTSAPASAGARRLTA